MKDKPLCCQTNSQELTLRTIIVNQLYWPIARMTVIHKMFSEFKLMSVIELLLVGATVWMLGVIVARLYFHPLSKFQGLGLPQWLDGMSSTTTSFATAHTSNTILSCTRSSVMLPRCGIGCFNHLADWPEGSIVRIGPNHVHVNDPDFYKEWVPNSRGDMFVNTIIQSIPKSNNIHEGTIFLWKFRHHGFSCGHLRSTKT